MSRMFKPHSHTLLGEGSKHGEVFQQYSELLSPVKDLLLAEVNSIPTVNDRGAFAIGHYGSSDGATTMFLTKDIVESFRKKYGEKIPIEVLYEDWPSNDFNGLFQTLHGVIPEPKSYLTSLKNVFPFATGASCYDLCCPEGIMDVIMSFETCQWLSKRGTVYRESLYRFPVSSQEEKKAVVEQGAEDWEKFLLMRTKEMRVGGILAVTLPTENVSAKKGQPRVSNQLLGEIYLSVWKDFQKRGRITREEFINTNFDLIARTKAELEVPFSSPYSVVRTAGLTLLAVEILQMNSCCTRHWKKKLEMQGIDDRVGFATQYVDSYRSWSNSVFLDGLSDKRTESEKNAIVDDFYREVTKELAKHRPDDPMLDIVGGFVLAKKVERNAAFSTKL